MATENLEQLKQLIDSLDKAVSKLEKAYKKEKYDDFHKTKKFVLETQNKISGMIKT